MKIIMIGTVVRNFVFNIRMIERGFTYNLPILKVWDLLFTVVYCVRILSFCLFFIA